MPDLTLNDLVSIAVAFFLGALLGVLYFSALWLTTQHLSKSHHPKTCLIVGLLVRALVLMIGFVFFLGVYHWERLVIALLGFIVARTIAIRLVALHPLKKDTANPSEKSQTGSTDDSDSTESSNKEDQASS